MISEKLLKQVIAETPTMRSAALKLGLSFNSFKRLAIKYGCYQPNQGGKGVKKGKRSTTAKTEDILTGKYPKYQTYQLKKRLINEGYFKDECQICGWNQKPIGAKYTPCELHHKDGNPHNHRLDNLIILCPNCHSITDTYRFRRGKNK